MGRILDLSKRNWQARCIYELIMEYKNDIEHEIDDTLIIEIFDNGRERGYTLKYKDKELSFAENRNSDDIVVYPFKWENNKNIEQDYKTKSKYFKREQFHKVFDYILEYFGINL